MVSQLFKVPGPTQKTYFSWEVVVLPVEGKMMKKIIDGWFTKYLSQKTIEDRAL